ncbi:MAG: hypothetical protein O2971_18040 [Proteobacteria bacterium]|nr:hypothetical protein [Pseudomonadota bacterium]
MRAEFNYPTDVAIDKDGRIVVADGYNDRIQVFSPSGVFMEQSGTTVPLHCQARHLRKTPVANTLWQGAL